MSIAMRAGKDRNINFSLYFRLSPPAIESVNWTISVTINGFYFLAQRQNKGFPKNKMYSPHLQKRFMALPILSLSVLFRGEIFCRRISLFCVCLRGMSSCHWSERIWFTYAICCSFSIPLYIGIVYSVLKSSRICQTVAVLGSVCGCPVLKTYKELPNLVRRICDGCATETRS